MDGMATLRRNRRLRWLVIHHRTHPSKHARRLVLRTQRWTGTRVRGVCRWCGDLTSTIDLTPLLPRCLPRCIWSETGRTAEDDVRDLRRPF